MLLRLRFHRLSNEESFFYPVFVVLEIKTSVSGMLSKCCAIKLHPSTRSLVLPMNLYSSIQEHQSTHPLSNLIN